MLPSNGDKSLGVVQNEGIGELSLISPLRRPGRRKPEERCRPGSRTQSYTFLYNCVLSRNIIPSSHLFLSPSRCILRSCVIARTPTLGLGHLRAKRLRRPYRDTRAPCSAGALPGAPAHPACCSHLLAPCAASLLCAAARRHDCQVASSLLTGAIGVQV